MNFSSSGCSQSHRLLSTSLDNSLIIWDADNPGGVWHPLHRFGTIGGKGLGYHGALWGADRRTIMASGWNGGWERWIENEGEWEPQSGVAGHFGAVTDVSWNLDGEYIISTR